MQETLREIKEAVRRHINRPISETANGLRASLGLLRLSCGAGQWIGAVGVAISCHGSLASAAFPRGSQRANAPWTRMAELADEYLPKP